MEKVVEQEMFHYHKKGIYDDIWQVGNSLEIDDSFRSYYSMILDNFSTAVHTVDDGFVSIDRVIEYYLNNFSELTEELTKQILTDSWKKIKNINVLNREKTMEEYRKNNYPYLPSRLHSIWLTDEKGLKFWAPALGEIKNLTLFKVCLTGKLFKSSDAFIPNEELSVLDMYKYSEKYWVPNFKDESQEDRAEYLFQGKVKILQKLAQNK